MKKAALAVFLITAVLLQQLNTTQVFAAYCDSTGNGKGRSACRGYFTNGSASASVGTVFNILDSGVYPNMSGSLTNQANSFESIVRNALYGSDSSDRVGAAFIIANMLGRNGTYFDSGSYQNVSGGIQYAKDNFATWSALVDSYASAGAVDFSKSVTYSSPYRNSAYFSDIQDDAFHEKGAETITVIEFVNSDGSTFRIQKSCANLVGGLSPLSPRIPPSTATLTSNATVSAATVNIGQSVTFNNRVTASNVSNVGAANFDVSVTGVSPTSAANRAIAGGNPRYTSSFTTSYATPGERCRRTTVSGVLGYVVLANNGARACVNVISPGAYSLNLPAVSHEKGSGNKNVVATLVVGSLPCDTTRPAGSIVTTIQWRLTGIDQTGAFSQTATALIPNCSGVPTGTTITHTVTTSYLDAQNPGLTPMFTTSATGSVGSTTVPVLPAPQQMQISIYEVPYLRIYGNDVSAAGCVDPRGSIVDGRPNAGNLYGGITASRRTMEVAYPATSAAPDPRTVYTGAGGNVYAGAAVEYAAIALTTRSNTILNGSFQNHTSSPIRLQAFWSAGNRTCPDTVYSKISGVESLPGIVDATIVAGGTISNMGSLGLSNNYYARASGNVTIDNPGASVSTSGKYTIYANGDVRITDNIIATKPAPFSNTTATVTLIIASGSIYIDPGVTQVDAVLIAQNDIYSCGNGGFGGQPQSTVHTNCRSKLTINGALNARYVHLQRSIGTRLLAPNNEQSTTAGGNAAAAEAINYPYYLYFTTPYLADKAESTFQSYFSPAPYF